jgi:hypothetical protein
MTLTPLTRQRLRVLLNEWSRGAVRIEQLFDHLEDLITEGVTPTTPVPGATRIAPLP